MKIAITGLPNSGKKTLFSLLCSVDYNQLLSNPSAVVFGKAKVLDKNLQVLSEMYNPKKTTNILLDFNLIPDLSIHSETNEKFYSQIEPNDIICFVARCFQDESIFHINGEVNPEKDILWFYNELILKDLMFIEKRIEKIKSEIRKIKSLEKEKELKLLEKLKNHLENENPLRTFNFTEAEAKLIQNYQFLTKKNLVIILNISESDINRPDILTDLENKFKEKDIIFLKICSKIEQEISQLETEEEKQEFMKELGIKKSALENITQSIFTKLGLINFYTVGKDEVRSWAIKKNTFAPVAAGVIHSDIQRGFIRAQVMKYNDLIAAGNEENLKKTGKFYTKGKDYIVEEKDIINFLFNI